MGRILPMLWLAGCGRFDFGPVAALDGSLDANGDGPDGLAGLIARFPFDDVAGSGTMSALPESRTVTCGAGCPVPSAQHVVGTSAAFFDGTVRVVLGDLIPNGPYTITVWLAPEAGMPFGSALGKPLDATTVLNDVSLTVESSVAFEGSRGGAIVTADGPVDIRGGVHHVALVFDGIARTVIVDGVSLVTLTGPFDTSSLPVAVGADLDANAFAVPYRGVIDDLRFYGRALRADELETIRAER